jgi:AmiR/NasT family two-component response regulator
MKPKILIISGNIKNCIKINDYFISYAKYIDYETDISKLEEEDYEKYDIIIYDLDFIMEEIQLKKQTNSLQPIIICITEENDDDYINKLMNSGVDIIIPYILNDISVKHMMSIYNLIEKNKYNEAIMC